LETIWLHFIFSWSALDIMPGFTDRD